MTTTHGLCGFVASPLRIYRVEISLSGAEKSIGLLIVVRCLVHDLDSWKKRDIVLRNTVIRWAVMDFITLAFLCGCVGAITVWIIIYVDARRQQAKRNKLIEDSRRTYATSLDQLRKSPTNPQFHEAALIAGRNFAAITRQNNAVTLFDETALANDIRAVTANASQAGTKAAAPTQSLDERIAALNKLKASGLMSDEEFEQKRKEIIASL